MKLTKWGFAPVIQHRYLLGRDITQLSGRLPCHYSRRLPDIMLINDLTFVMYKWYSWNWWNGGCSSYPTYLREALLNHRVGCLVTILVAFQTSCLSMIYLGKIILLWLMTLFHAMHISNNYGPIPFPIRNYCHCTATTNRFPLADNAPSYLLLPLGKWGSKWGDFHLAMGVFNHGKGAIWQSHLAAQKEGVVTTIIFSNHKTY